MELFGIKLVGFNPENLHKLYLTLIFFIAVFVIKGIINYYFLQLPREKDKEKFRFWTRQGINLFFAFATLIIFLSIWFDDPRRLSTGLGLVTAGLAFALQKVVTSFAGYLVIMRGNTFSVGERITMGGIRGDVISLGFLQTTIMEMGQPPRVQGADPAMWIKGRQFTGRIVTVTNDKIFETPVFNYTRDFPFIWEEISIPVKYSEDRQFVEKKLMEIVNRYTHDAFKKSQRASSVIRDKYGIRPDDALPKIYYRLTENWLEITARFITEDHGVRDIKDQITRDLLDALDSRHIEFPIPVYEIVGLPKIVHSKTRDRRDQASLRQ